LFYSAVSPAQSESANVSADWRTFAEQTDYRNSSYAETVALRAKKLDEVSGRIQYQSFGASGEVAEICRFNRVTMRRGGAKKGKGLF